MVEYVIDGRNRRVGRKVDGALTHGWIYQDQLSPVAELDSAGAVLTRYVYGTRAHVPDYLVRGGTTYRIVADHPGSVRLVVEVGSGAVAQRILRGVDPRTLCPVPADQRIDEAAVF